MAPLQNSSYDGSFIAGIAQLRYLYSMPVERIVAYFNENGFDLDKQTAHGLLKKTADLFGNLYKAVRKAVKEDGYLCCDETYHTVRLRKEEDGGREAVRDMSGSLQLCTLDLCTSSMTTVHAARTSSSGN